MEKWVVFDDNCRFCSACIGFLKRRDKKRMYSYEGQNQIDTKHPLFEKTQRVTGDSVLLVTHEQVFQYSDAVIRIASGLGGAWVLIRLCLLIPKGIRDSLYRAIAVRRNICKVDSENCRISPQDTEHIQ